VIANPGVCHGPTGYSGGKRFGERDESEALSMTLKIEMVKSDSIDQD
jgi:hypothetical protein